MTRTEAIAIGILYSCATLQFIRFYVVNATFYLDLPRYLSGHERLPFQERVLPILLIRFFDRIFSMSHAAAHTKGAFTPEHAAFYVISLLAMLAGGIFAQKLYDLVSGSRLLAALVYPTYLFAMMWTYSIHTEANFSYPYDMLAVAFFSAGLYFIYRRRFLPLLFVILVGTLNRETTLFLIGIYVLDAASSGLVEPVGDLRARFSPELVPWMRVLLLFAIWVAIRVALAHAFAGNDARENYLRLGENVGRLKPRLWPALLNVCGYMLPIVLLLRRYLRPLRFRNYLFILPLWFAVMFSTGVIVETRIYGELCPYVAVAIVLILEWYAAIVYSGRLGVERASEDALVGPGV